MLDYVYNIVFFLLTYLLPMIVMAACYSQMGHFLSKYDRERQSRMMISSAASTRIRKNKKKVRSAVHCSLLEYLKLTSLTAEINCVIQPATKSSELRQKIRVSIEGFAFVNH